MSALSVVIALTSCHQQGKQFRPPDARNSFVGNQLFMMGIVNPKTGKPESWTKRQLNKLWIIYADNEMTNSTAAFLHITSTLADPISGSYRSFQQIGPKENVAKLIADVKAKKQRLFGYGHRIYKAVDPRIYHLRKMMDDLAGRAASNPLLSIAMEIDRIASQDTYFTSRNLKANADLGFEPEIITAIAAMARSSGVMAHWREAMSDRPNIWRPQQVFTGVVLCDLNVRLFPLTL
ncbi:b53e404c-d722-49ca-985c-85d82e541795 [Sclerotinia trifoliorum]|uniref:B53e404c-d722-49ca-985c-85d82e541795 n=1 Tax=Sclerotinia trifoliorum TaxID=28548 RepID=A0A8H2VL38_9HELO|nr:b53e404c-d722-49ca-985c-85d82e541795 [Sclerotinia trifoliorum]